MTDNPSVQCWVCGKWKRLFKANSGDQYIFPDEVGHNWCTDCIDEHPIEYKKAEKPQSRTSDLPRPSEAT